jgi:quercetin dioxygenase-like cupin family protein
MRVIVVALPIIIAAALPVRAEGPTVDLVGGPDAVKWSPAPPSFPKGAMAAVLAGDPSKDGPYVVRLKMPANYQIPAHNHPATENVTVLSGSFHAGMGDKLDTGKGQAFAPGGFVAMPAGMNHYAWTTAETIVQVHGKGPFVIVYVNPADDPSKTQ